MAGKCLRSCSVQKEMVWRGKVDAERWSVRIAAVFVPMSFVGTRCVGGARVICGRSVSGIGRTSSC